MHTAVYGSRNKEQVAATIQKAEEVSRKCTDPMLPGLVRLARGIAAYLQGNWRAAYEHCCEAEKIFRSSCTGVFWEVDTACIFALWSLTYIGDADTIRRRRLFTSTMRSKGTIDTWTTC
jgi:hypothetical protein